MNDDMAAARTAHPGPPALVRVAAVAVSGARAAGARARVRGGRVGRDGARQHRRQAAHRSRVRADLGGDRRARRCRCSCIRPRRPAWREMDMVALPAHRVDRLHVRHVARGRADDLRRLLRPLPEAQDHRGARRRRAAVPHLADGPVLRQHSGVPREDLAPAVRVPAEDLRRRRRVRARGARPVRQGLRRRQRDVRLRLSAHDRRHAGVPASA